MFYWWFLNFGQKMCVQVLHMLFDLVIFNVFCCRCFFYLQCFVLIIFYLSNIPTIISWYTVIVPAFELNQIDVFVVLMTITAIFLLLLLLLHYFFRLIGVYWGLLLLLLSLFLVIVVLFIISRLIVDCGWCFNKKAFFI